jgi:hypothetical protein
MNDTVAELNILEQKIEFMINAFHKIHDENEHLKKELTIAERELKLKDEKVHILSATLQNKEQELQSMITKLDKILV